MNVVQTIRDLVSTDPCFGSAAREFKMKCGEKKLIHDARMDFYKFVREHDRRRSTDFLSTFPGFRKFYDECKELCEPRATEQANA